MADLELKKLHDDLSAATTAFREANDRLEAETKRVGAGSVEAKALVDKMNARLDDIEVKMQRARFMRDGTGQSEAKSDVDVIETKAFNNFARFGDERLSVEERKAVAERKSLTTDSDPDGGYVVPTTTSSRFIRKLILVSPIRQYATVETISKGNDLEIPAEGPQSFAAGRVGQRSTRPETAAGQMRLEKIPTHEYYAKPMLTQQMIDDTSMDVEGWAADRVGTAIGQIEGQDFVAGSGVGGPEGFNSSSVTDIHGGDAALIKIDGLFDMMADLPTYYAQNARIYSNRKTKYAIRKLKDGQGQYLWQPSVIVGAPPTFDGTEVVEIYDMPDIAANAFPVVYGDLKAAYTIVDRMQLRLLRDPYTSKPFVELYFTKRTGGQIVLAEALRRLKIAV
ncbi:MAG TPA: phage major capsid protein [Gemmatimonadaceae bacterium]|nr:phage major capsid protein [Gemmatimonadaceae bacterium]